MEQCINCILVCAGTSRTDFLFPVLSRADRWEETGSFMEQALFSVSFKPTLH